MNTAYLDYLEKTLGLKSLLWPLALQQASTANMRDQKSLRILFLEEHPWSQPARELFEKMREAMKISSDQIQILFANQVSQAEIQVQSLTAQRVVCFSQNLFDQISVEAPFKFFTHSPEQLLLHPTKKKEAWSELQKVMKSLGLL